jgi:hypothetical protein
MNTTTRRYCLFLLAALCGLAFASCASMRPISSRPPVGKIVLTAPFTTSTITTKISLPAGEYRPAYEDNDYYYYQAPAKLVINRFNSRMFDGGIYIPRSGATVLRGCYFVEDDGMPTYHKFEQEPAYRVAR